MSIVSVRGHPAATVRSDTFGGSPEPDVLHSLLNDVTSMRGTFRRLGDLVADRALHDARPCWRSLHQEVRAAHQRVELLLRDAAESDGVGLPPLPAAEEPAAESAETMISHCRRLARELEEQCAGAARCASDVGLSALAGALQRWRCELIGLERPLIASHAQVGGSARR